MHNLQGNKVNLYIIICQEAIMACIYNQTKHNSAYDVMSKVQFYY